MVVPDFDPPCEFGICPPLVLNQPAETFPSAPMAPIQKEPRYPLHYHDCAALARVVREVCAMKVVLLEVCCIVEVARSGGVVEVATVWSQGGVP